MWVLMGLVGGGGPRRCGLESKGPARADVSIKRWQTGQTHPPTHPAICLKQVLFAFELQRRLGARGIQVGVES